MSKINVYLKDTFTRVMECRGVKRCDFCGCEVEQYVHCVIDGKGGIVCVPCWQVMNGREARRDEAKKVEPGRDAGGDGAI